MKIAIIGAGGHAKEVYQSIIQQKTEYELAGFFVESEFHIEGSFLYGLPIKNIDELNIDIHLIHIAVGDIEFRYKIYRNLKEFGFQFINIIDSNSIFRNPLVLGEGVYVAPGAIVTADVKIGNCVIVNTGAILSHDCDVEDFCNISPGSIICGGVRIGQKTFVGAGSVLREKIWVHNNVVIGMGSIVTKNILNSGIYINNSSYSIKLNKS